MAGLAGYPDWQNVVNWESPTLYMISRAVIGARNAFDSGVLEVSRYAGVHLIASTGENRAFVTLTWYLEQEAGFTCGERTVLVEFNVRARMNARIMNAGPFVRVTGGVSGGIQIVEVALTGSNRIGEAEIVSGEPYVASLEEEGLAGGADVRLFASAYSATPVEVIQRSSSTRLRVTLSTFLPSFREIVLTEIESAAGTRVSTRLVLPAAPVFSEIRNLGLIERTTAEFVIIPSLTGAT